MSISAVDLRVERGREPIGLGTTRPRLSWKLEASANETDVIRQAWQVQVVKTRLLGIPGASGGALSP